LPRYEVEDEGPEHAKRFFATVHLDGAARGRGEGRSKKQAEQGAARMAWQALSALLAAVTAPDGGPGEPGAEEAEAVPGA
ncbi:MAG TPA: putative dsRNA-binding protein, partial [Acidimicrobiales bacterium]|nr:putative dsRNA-binding protein [Acidimicrobiales bacterium]